MSSSHIYYSPSSSYVYICAFSKVAVIIRKLIKTRWKYRKRQQTWFARALYRPSAVCTLAILYIEHKLYISCVIHNIYWLVIYTYPQRRKGRGKKLMSYKLAYSATCLLCVTSHDRPRHIFPRLVLCAVQSCVCVSSISIFQPSSRRPRIRHVIYTLLHTHCVILANICCYIESTNQPNAARTYPILKVNQTYILRNLCAVL